MPRKFEEALLVIASHNSGKISEISALLDFHKIKSHNAKALGLIEPEENGLNYLDNALIKARACIEVTHQAALSDDSGIEVEALEGRPGVDTAPYTQSLGGREKVFELWQKNQAIRKNPRAIFVCVQVLMWPDGYYEAFRAEVPGKLVFPPRGMHGHGYDPVFMPEHSLRTMAELSFDEKNSYSHRSQAFKKLIEACFLVK